MANTYSVTIIILPLSDALNVTVIDGDGTATTINTPSDTGRPSAASCSDVAAMDGDVANASTADTCTFILTRGIGNQLACTCPLPIDG